MERRCFSTSIYLIHISFNKFRYRMVVIQFIQLGAFKNRQIKFIHSISTWPSTKHTPKCNKLPSSFFLQQFQKMLNVLKGDKSCGTNAHCSMYIGAERNADLIRFIQFNRTGTFSPCSFEEKINSLTFSLKYENRYRIPWGWWWDGKWNHETIW